MVERQPIDAETRQSIKIRVNPKSIASFRQSRIGSTDLFSHHRLVLINPPLCFFFAFCFLFCFFCVQLTAALERLAKLEGQVYGEVSLEAGNILRFAKAAPFQGRLSGLREVRRVLLVVELVVVAVVGIKNSGRRVVAVTFVAVVL